MMIWWTRARVERPSREYQCCACAHIELRLSYSFLTDRGFSTLTKYPLATVKVGPLTDDGRPLQLDLMGALRSLETKYPDRETGSMNHSLALGVWQGKEETSILDPHYTWGVRLRVDRTRMAGDESVISLFLFASTGLRACCKSWRPHFVQTHLRPSPSTSYLGSRLRNIGGSFQLQLICLGRGRGVAGIRLRVMVSVTLHSPCGNGE